VATVSLENLTKRFDEVVAVTGVNLEIQDQEFVVLVGPSGCGKSTTLRMIAGLEEISDGKVFIGGRLVNDVPPKDRDIAMVFQNYALYPHMSVYDNMAFGLKLRKFPREEIAQRVREAAEILGIAGAPPPQAEGPLRRPATAGRGGPGNRPRADVLLDLQAGTDTLTARVDPHLTVRVKDRIRLALAEEKMRFFDPETEQVIR